ncbi:uncharacterized protein LOC139928027 [Centroberyx gerrardi]|uniref:uncharacterized protein n=1 Tax=Centroberyx gerrardi TaxID=166262 RepID=UPI003AAB6380
MPNIRQMAKRERKTQQWAPAAMEQAIEEVRAGRCSARQAAKVFKVPKSSLCDRLSGKVTSGCHIGRSTYLSTEDENSLVDYWLYSASHGFPVTKPQVLAHALAIYNLRHPDDPKTTLGQTWWINFRERHHHRLGTLDVIDRGKAACTKTGPIEDYFHLLSKIMEEHGLREKPRQIYSCDKTGFLVVNVSRATKHANKLVEETRECITVLACFNAAGEDVPPFIVYKGTYPVGPYNKEGVPHSLYGKSPAGHLDSTLFRKWFVKHFLKYATQQRPLLLVLDGHQLHLDPELVRAAQREGVFLLCLPPCTSHILQPLDVNFFVPLKTDFVRLMGPLSVVSKKDFSVVFRHSYQRVKDRRRVEAGFRNCGLYPLDPTAVDCLQVKEDASPGPPAAAPSPRRPPVPVEAPLQLFSP